MAPGKASVVRWPLLLLLLRAAIIASAVSRQPPLYHELGLNINATSDEIVRAYQQHAQPWSVDKQYTPDEIRIIIEIEHAYHVLSNNLTRRDYDYFQYDPLQADVERIRKAYEGRTESEYLDFPLWMPERMGTTIGSTAHTVTYSNFGDLVLSGSSPWVIQIYSVASPECHAFAPIWNRTVEHLEGVVEVGRVELGELPLALIFAERNWLRGFPFFRNGLPAFIAVPSDCDRLGCITRYYGEKDSEALADWVATRLLRLPRILYYSAQTLMSELIQKAAPHKVKIIQFSATGDRAALYLRKAAKDYWNFAVFAMVLWRESDASFWEERVGVELAPATVFVKDPGLPPIIRHGKLTSSEFQDLIEDHKSFELPQLRSITSANMGCDVSDHSRARTEANIWYCVIVVGRPGSALNKLRGILRDVQGQFKYNATEETFLAPGVKAHRDKRLSLAWLDGETQKDICYFYLHSATVFEACGPRKYEMGDIPKIILIRYIRVDSQKAAESHKKRWLPMTTWEKQVENQKKNAAQLVTTYNGSAGVAQVGDCRTYAEECFKREVMRDERRAGVIQCGRLSAVLCFSCAQGKVANWISAMVVEGDNEDLPSFSGKAPHLIVEETEPLMAKAQGFVYDKRERLFERGKGVLRAAQDLREDPKFFATVLCIATFYASACYISARQKSRQRNQVPTDATGLGNTQDTRRDVGSKGSPIDPEEPTRQKLFSASEGLRKRESFKSS